MKTEEAIDYLERCADGLDPDFDNAVSLAVSALRAQQEADKNEPLTLDELREMDGEPVWDNFLMEWCIIIMMDFWNGKGAVKYFDGGFNPLSEKRFYRHKPKEAYDGKPEG